MIRMMAVAINANNETTQPASKQINVGRCATPKFIAPELSLKTNITMVAATIYTLSPKATFLHQSPIVSGVEFICERGNDA